MWPFFAILGGLSFTTFGKKALATLLPSVVYGPHRPYGPTLPAMMNDPLMAAARPILNLIAMHESQGNYNMVYGGKIEPLTSMTIRSVYALQDRMVSQNRVSSAVGRYQFIKKTLQGLVSTLGVNPDTTKLDTVTQDTFALQLLKQRGFERFLKGQMSRNTFVLALAQEWASMPKDQSNRTFYNDGVNRALTTYTTVISALEQSKQNYGVA